MKKIQQALSLMSCMINSGEQHSQTSLRIKDEAFEELELLSEGRFVFHATQESEAVLTLSHEGFTYKGELIEDAGRAYDLFIKFMEQGQ